MTLEKLPAVSVIVPVYNAAGDVAACVEALLAQDYPGDLLEIICVDNGSGDGSAALIARYPVRLLREDAVPGSYAARNAGARAARGEILAFCDADETPARDWLRRLLRQWEDPAVGGFAGEVRPAAGAATLFDRFVSERESGYIEEWRGNRFGPTAGTGNFAVRRAVFERLGGFDQELPSGADLMFGWTITGKLGLRLAYEPEALVYHRPRADEAGYMRREQRLAFGRMMLNERLGRSDETARLVRRHLWRLISGSVAYAAHKLLRPAADWEYRAYAARMNARLAWAYWRGMRRYKRRAEKPEVVR